MHIHIAVLFNVLLIFLMASLKCNYRNLSFLRLIVKLGLPKLLYVFCPKKKDFALVCGLHREAQQHAHSVMLAVAAIRVDPRRLAG